MLKYILRRIIQAIPTFFGITLLSYFLMTAAPGGPQTILINDPRLNNTQREAIARRLGVNDPWPVQYLRWLIGNDWQRFDLDGDGIANEPGQRRGILRGDFGYSLFSKRPVIDLVFERIPATLELGVTALIVSLTLGIAVGIIAAVGRGGLFDNASRVLAVLFNAIPGFWLGLILILLFSPFLNQYFGDSIGRCPTPRTAEDIINGCPAMPNRVHLLILPVFVLSAGGIAVFSRFMRASMLDVINQDYIRTGAPKVSIHVQSGSGMAHATPSFPLRPLSVRPLPVCWAERRLLNASSPGPAWVNSVLIRYFSKITQSSWRS